MLQKFHRELLQLRYFFSPFGRRGLINLGFFKIALDIQVRVGMVVSVWFMLIFHYHNESAFQTVLTSASGERLALMERRLIHHTGDLVRPIAENFILPVSLSNF